MHSQQTIERFFDTLTTGNRPRARAIIEEMTAAGWTAQRLVADLFWPTYELIDRLHREDQLATLAHHTATRLLRVLVDQNSARLERSPQIGRKIMAFCGPAEGDEMGAQMAVDMLESQGFEVTFAGGGIAADEILNQVNNHKPDVVMMFASGPSDLPGIRTLIDTIREVGACPDVQFAVGAGIFNRAEGLAEEIGADLWASTPLEMVEVLVAEPERRATSDQRTVGGKRIRRRAA